MRRMFSLQELKNLIAGMTAEKANVYTAEQPTQEILNKIKVGDAANFTSFNGLTLYVTEKTDSFIRFAGLISADMGGADRTNYIELMEYNNYGSGWVLVSPSYKIKLGDALPDVTGASAGDVLGLDANKDKVWIPLIGKYVRIMPAPSSTTLTDEQIAQIQEGVFINGDFLGIHNPVLFPHRTNSGFLIGQAKEPNSQNYIALYKINTTTKVISISTYILQIDGANRVLLSSIYKINEKVIPDYPSNSVVGQFICRKGTLDYYVPVAVTGITSGDDLAGVQDNLVSAMKDHLDVEINGHRCRFEKDDGTYVVYSWRDEVDSGVNLQVNMISLLIASPNTISFNLMKFAPVV